MRVGIRMDYGYRSMSSPLTFAQVREVNVARCEESYFPLNQWSLSDWGVALAGECGEACDAIKKVNRGDGDLEEVAKELADVVLYCDLLAASIGVDLADAVAKKFNEVSARPKVNSHYRLPVIEDEIPSPSSE